MTTVDVGTMLAQGLAAHQAGRLDEAEGRYRSVLTTHPTNPDALHLIGVVALQRGRLGDAMASVRQALTVAPGQPSFWNTLGVAERADGQLDAAAASLGRAVELAPEYLDAWDNLANVHQLRGDQVAEAAALERVTALQPANAQVWARRGVLALYADQLAAACAHLQESLALVPHDAGVWSNLGVAQLQLGRLADAELSQRQATALQPDNVFAWNNLGNVLVARSRWQEASDVLAGVVERVPDDANGWINLGHALKGLGRYEEARDAYQRGVALQPESAVALVGIGDTFQKLGDPFGSMVWYERALALQPHNEDACEHLGVAAQTLGETARAEEMFRRCLAINPDRANVHSNLIFVLDLRQGAQQAAFEERQRWNARFGKPAGAPPAVHLNDRTPGRRLRVGYVSADFREHSAAYIVLPILCAHDRSQVQVVCYSGVTQPDQMTEQLRAVADRWHDVAYLNDDELAALIRHDEIDLLVDLSGHSGGNRLPVFAQEPAPVQLTTWGYSTGTGLNTMHYFLADAVVVPPEGRHWYSEEVVNLPSLICYEPPETVPAVGPPPVLKRGYITFGAFNRVDKATDNVRDVWAQVMQAIPDARLLVKAAGGAEHSRQQLADDLVVRGVARERIEVLSHTDRTAHLATHNEIDILLDTFPHGGGVTSVEALLMGVPVITVLGEQVAGRLAASFLTTLGMSDLIARTPDEYVEIAARLAGDRDRLTHERATLRQRLYASPIADTQAYTRAVEDVYRELWGRWCHGTQESPLPQPLRGANIGCADILSRARERGVSSPLPRTGEGLGEGACYRGEISV